MKSNIFLTSEAELVGDWVSIVTELLVFSVMQLFIYSYRLVNQPESFEQFAIALNRLERIITHELFRTPRTKTALNGIKFLGYKYLIICQQWRLKRFQSSHCVCCLWTVCTAGNDKILPTKDYHVFWTCAVVIPWCSLKYLGIPCKYNSGKSLIVPHRRILGHMR